MAKIIFNETEIKTNSLQINSGLASPYEEEGDGLFIKALNDDLVILTICDGVSSSKSPHKSSKKIIKALKDFFNRKKKLDLNSYLDFITDINQKLLKKEYASTFSQIILAKDKVYTINIGDSQTLLFGKEAELIYESWPHNIGFSNDKNNDKSHIITNWIGSESLRLEITLFNRSMVSSGLIFSDGLLDIIDIKNLNYPLIKEELVSKFDSLSSENLLDDTSYIFFKNL